MKVLKVPAMLFATLHESGTPVKKHLDSMAFLGWPDDIGSLSNETYITIRESPPEGEHEPHVIHHKEEPPTGGTPIHPEVEPPTGGFPLHRYPLVLQWSLRLGGFNSCP